LAGRGEALAQISQKFFVAGIELLTKIFGGLLSFLEITVDLLAMVQVIGDGSVNLRKGQSWIVLADFLWGCTVSIRVNHTIERNTGIGDSKAPLRSAHKKIGNIYRTIHRNNLKLPWEQGQPTVDCGR
jgi:hypothetical protein